MNTQTIIEIVGYIGSLLVLISFLMTSVAKLRIVNSIGSFIFMVYALIIKSYPTAIMNFCLILINLHFLYKTNKSHKAYDLIEAEDNDAYLNYILNYYAKDIEECFPNTSLDLDKYNKNFIISYEGKPVGFAIGEQNGDCLQLHIDYSIPEYRDYSIGKFLFDKLKEKGIKKIISKVPTLNHIKYLEKNGFIKKDEFYEKEL